MRIPRILFILAALLLVACSAQTESPKNVSQALPTEVASSTPISPTEDPALRFTPPPQPTAIPTTVLTPEPPPLPTPHPTSEGHVYTPNDLADVPESGLSNAEAQEQVLASVLSQGSDEANSSDTTQSEFTGQIGGGPSATAEGSTNVSDNSDVALSSVQADESSQVGDVSNASGVDLTVDESTERRIMGDGCVTVYPDDFRWTSHSSKSSEDVFEFYTFKVIAETRPITTGMLAGETLVMYPGNSGHHIGTDTGMYAVFFDMLYLTSLESGFPQHELAVLSVESISLEVATRGTFVGAYSSHHTLHIPLYLETYGLESESNNYYLLPYACNVNQVEVQYQQDAEMH